MDGWMVQAGATREVKQAACGEGVVCRRGVGDGGLRGEAEGGGRSIGVAGMWTLGGGRRWVSFATSVAG
jgi:hypothetical protein